MILQSHRLKATSKELKEAIEQIATADVFKEYDLAVRSCTSTSAGFCFYDVQLPHNSPLIPKGITAEMIAEETGCTVTQEGLIFWLETEKE